MGSIEGVGVSHNFGSIDAKSAHIVRQEPLLALQLFTNAVRVD